MHLDFAPNPDDLDLALRLRADRALQVGRARRHRPRHQAVDRPARAVRPGCARRMADAGVALTVLPSTDLYLMGRHMNHSVMRGVTEAHKLLHHGVNCSLSTNNVLNPFTPFGDCSLVRMANLYANICQVGAQRDIRECFNMITTRSARLLEPEGLRPRGRQIGRSRRARCREPGAGRGRALARALRLQAWPPHRHPHARPAAPAGLTRRKSAI